MEIFKNYDLTKLNTFGITARAKFFVEIKNTADLQELFDLPEFKNSEKFILGGGSNVLFTKDFNGIVIFNKLKGIEILREDPEFVWIKAMSGVVWHDLISFVVSRGYWGIENLSLIPGTVGGAPVQNIGAYGAELKNVLENVEALGIPDGQKKIFIREECELGYRDSIFKNKDKGKYFILSITLKLSKKEKKNISYKILREYLDKNKVKAKNPKDIADAVAAIRLSKLPDPAIIGNAGSFFKNVFVSDAELRNLSEKYPDMPYFTEEEQIKIPAAWLIEQCGWKGKRTGNVGVHEKQALVLVNYGGATGAEVENLAEQIIRSVSAKFGLILTPEVNLI